jgi:hypothetical protein
MGLMDRLWIATSQMMALWWVLMDGLLIATSNMVALW